MYHRVFSPCRRLLQGSIIIVLLALYFEAAPAQGMVAEDFQALHITQFEEVIEAPDFTLATTSGESLRLSDLKGKVVLLNFWATW